MFLQIITLFLPFFLGSRIRNLLYLVLKLFIFVSTLRKSFEKDSCLLRANVVWGWSLCSEETLTVNSTCSKRHVHTCADFCGKKWDFLFQWNCQNFCVLLLQMNNDQIILFSMRILNQSQSQQSWKKLTKVNIFAKVKLIS